jgi:hypothetical protein
MLPPLPYPGAVTEIHGRSLPGAAIPAGYAALAAAYDLRMKLPRTLSAIGARHRVREQDGWRILTPRHAPAQTLEAHLTFALKYEGVDLAVLKTLFSVIDPGQIAAMVRAKPTGRYVRRIWFFYEWLTGIMLDLPLLRRGSYVNALDPALQYTAPAANSPRHRVRNNMPGTPAFCPLVFRTKTLEAAAVMNLPARIRAGLGQVSVQEQTIIAHLFVTGELAPNGNQTVPRAIYEQWYDAFSNAGQSWPASLLEGADTGRLGVLERPLNYPDPVIAAACASFGGAALLRRTDPRDPAHRFILQHILASRGFAPDGYVLPIAMAALRYEDEYRCLLADAEARSTMDCAVLFDATPYAEFLYRCLGDLTEHGLTGAVAFARHFVAFYEASPAEYPVRLVTYFFDKLRETGGTLPRRSLPRCRMTPEQFEMFETLYAKTAPAAM